MIMTKKRESFKSSPKRFHPRGLEILYEDYDILVVNKSSGLLTIGTDQEKEKTAHYLLNEYVRKGNPKSKNRIFVVHRLDRDTSGVLVFAKDMKSKQYLQDHWQDFDKTYFAVVHGILKEKEGQLSSQLRENKAHRVYSTDDEEEGKAALTAYKVVRESDKYSLLEIKLLTGRKNQIRVHFADLGHPVVGDSVYGKKGGGRMALHSASLSLTHPFTQEKLDFKKDTPAHFKTLLKH
jgi:tRNA pseudouridine32 synthase/23S rRNA pseudouridine746 synthase/23S rRNA pseudouridine1911/1915/1917 synthase